MRIHGRKFRYVDCKDKTHFGKVRKTRTFFTKIGVSKVKVKLIRLSRKVQVGIDAIEFY